MKDKKYKRRMVEDDDDFDYDPNQGRSQRAPKQPFYYCMDCGQEFRKKERVCSCCGSTNIRRGER